MAKRMLINLLRGDHFKAMTDIVNIKGSCVVSGKNGTGKTTYLDLIMWVLFNKGIDIKAISPENIEFPNIPVIGVVNVMIDGSEYTLERRQADGKSEYIINGVPKKKKEWDAFLNDNLIDTETMIALMNPNYFCSKTTDAKKEILLKMAKSHSDEEIVKMLGFDFDLSEKTLADYKAVAKNDMKNIETLCGKKFVYISRQLDTANTIKTELESAKAGKKAIEIIDKCIDNIKANLERYTQQYADNERILFQIGQVDEKKEELMMAEINAHFSVVKFKMSEVAKNGNTLSCCVPMLDGFEVGDSANTARELMAKIDICRGLQTFYGINLPILLDNAECLDKKSTGCVRGMLKDTQFIMCKVTDSKLSVKGI